MATANLSRETESFEFGKEQKVIVNDLGDIAGGRTLDTTGYSLDVIKAGHIIIKTQAGEYKPLGLNSGKTAYVTVGENDTVVGVLKTTILTSKPMAPIMTMGQVNADVLPYPVTEAIKQALPNIQFM